MEMNYEIVLQKMPGHIEEIEKVFCKDAMALADRADELAKKSGLPANEKIAAELRQTLTALAEKAKAFCGSEGDTLEGDGTAWGAVHAAKQIKAVAEGGAN